MLTSHKLITNSFLTGGIGAFIARSTADPKNMDLNEIARTSGAASFPSADVVSSGSHATIAETADQINRGKGTGKRLNWMNFVLD